MPFSVFIGGNDVTIYSNLRDSPLTVEQNSLLIPVLTMGIYNNFTDSSASQITPPIAFDEVIITLQNKIIFGGIITSVTPRRLSDKILLYEISAVGYHKTLNYIETFRDDFASVKAGAIIRNLIGKYVPWISATATNIQDGPVISQLRVRNRSLSELFSELAQDSGFRFFIDNSKNAFFIPKEQYQSSLLITDDAISYIPDSLEVAPDFTRVVNVVKVLGGFQKGIQVTELFSGDGLNGNFSLEFNPFGIDRASLLFDDFGGTEFSTTWVESDVSNPSPPPNHVPSDGYIFPEFNRIQVVGGASVWGAVALVSVETHQRKQHREFSCEEIFIVGGSACVVCSLTDGLGQSNTNVLSGFDFLQGSEIHVRENGSFVSVSSYIDSSGITINAPVTYQNNQTYSLMIQTYLTGSETGTVPWGVKYFIQGGTAPNYGSVGSRDWSLIRDAQFSADPQEFVSFAPIIMYVGGGMTIRNSRIKDAVPITLFVGSDSKNVGVETDTGSKTDAFIDTNSTPNRLRFFSDVIPPTGVNNISLTYNKIQDTVIRRRDVASIARIKSLSSLANDSGERHKTIAPPYEAKTTDDLIRIALNYLSEFSAEKYTGSFTTFTPLLTVDTDPPTVGQLLNLNLPSRNIGPLDVVISRIVSTVQSAPHIDGSGATSPILRQEIEFSDVDTYQDFITRNQQDLKFIDKEGDASQFLDVWDLSSLMTLSSSLTSQVFSVSNAEVGTAEVGLSNVGENIT